MRAMSDVIDGALVGVVEQRSDDLGLENPNCFLRSSANNDVSARRSAIRLRERPGDPPTPLRYSASTFFSVSVFVTVRSLGF